MIKLPLTSDPVQTFTTQLGDTKYDFYVRFNDRAGYWTTDITDTYSQTKLISGMPLLLGCDLLDPYLLMAGRMMVYDELGTSTDAGDPDTGDLGSRVNVYWFTPDEVANV